MNTVVTYALVTGHWSLVTGHWSLVAGGQFNPSLQVVTAALMPDFRDVIFGHRAAPGKAVKQQDDAVGGGEGDHLASSESSLSDSFASGKLSLGSISGHRGHATPAESSEMPLQVIGGAPAASSYPGLPQFQVLLNDKVCPVSMPNSSKQNSYVFEILARMEPPRCRKPSHSWLLTAACTSSITRRSWCTLRLQSGGSCLQTGNRFLIASCSS